MYYIRSSVFAFIVWHTGEATLEEKAKIMITALGLKARVAGKSSAYSAYSNTLFNHKRRKSICSLSSGQICKQGMPYGNLLHIPFSVTTACTC